MAEIENPRIRQFYQDALTFIQATKATSKADPCFQIRPGTAEWVAWAVYLENRCGSLPIAMRQVEARRADAYTVPARSPEWFDQAYLPPEKPFYRSSHRPDPTPAEREKVLASMERYKRNPPGPILGDPSWALLDKKGSNRKLIGFRQASEALRPYTGRNKPEDSAA